MRNPFPVPSPLQRYHLQALLDVVERCDERGWCDGTAGNFSLRGSGDVVWVSPSGISKRHLEVRSFLAVDLTSGKLIGPEVGRPSGEMAAHLGLYRRDPSIKAVVHVHPPHPVSYTHLTLPTKQMV